MEIQTFPSGKTTRLASVALTVGVPHFSNELHFGRTVGVVVRELQLGLEKTALSNFQ